MGTNDEQLGGNSRGDNNSRIDLQLDLTTEEEQKNITDSLAVSHTIEKDADMNPSINIAQPKPKPISNTLSTPISITLPIVALVTFISVLAFVSINDAAPVTVNVVVFGFGAPYSTGFLNCLSLVILCEDVVHIAFLFFSFSKIDEAINISSQTDAQALYTPKKGILSFEYTKLDIVS